MSGKRQTIPKMRGRDGMSRRWEPSWSCFRREEAEGVPRQPVTGESCPWVSSRACRRSGPHEA